MFRASGKVKRRIEHVAAEFFGEISGWLYLTRTTGKTTSRTPATRQVTSSTESATRQAPVLSASVTLPVRRPPTATGAAETVEEKQQVETDKVREDLSHVQIVIDSLPYDLSAKLRNQAESFIRRHETMFSKSEFDLGRTTLVQHRIDTGHHRLFKKKLRRHPVVLLSISDTRTTDVAKWYYRTCRFIVDIKHRNR